MFSLGDDTPDPHHRSPRGRGCQALPSDNARPEAYLGQLSNLQIEADDKSIPANPEHQPGCILGKAEGGVRAGPGGVGRGRVNGLKRPLQGNYDSASLRERFSVYKSSYNQAPLREPCRESAVFLFKAKLRLREEVYVFQDHTARKR